MYGLQKKDVSLGGGNVPLQKSRQSDAPLLTARERRSKTREIKAFDGGRFWDRPRAPVVAWLGKGTS